MCTIHSIPSPASSSASYVTTHLAQCCLTALEVSYCAAVSEVELSRAPDASATAVRVDDTGSHALVSIKSGNTLGSTPEHLYIYSKWKGAKSIPKLKGTNITAAAWNAATVSEGSSG